MQNKSKQTKKSDKRINLSFKKTEADRKLYNTIINSSDFSAFVKDILSGRSKPLDVSGLSTKVSYAKQDTAEPALNISISFNNSEADQMMYNKIKSMSSYSAYMKDILKGAREPIDVSGLSTTVDYNRTKKLEKEIFTATEDTPIQPVQKVVCENKEPINTLHQEATKVVQEEKPKIKIDRPFINNELFDD